MPEEIKLRPTPETDALLSEFFSACRPSGGACGQTVGAESWSLRFTGRRRGEFEESIRRPERERDGARTELDQFAVSLAEALGWKQRWSCDEDHDGWYRPGSEVPEDVPAPSVLLASLVAQRDRLLEALVECEGDFACYDGDPHFPDENATLQRVRAAIAEVKGNR